MTTYNSYEEAKVANPECGIYRLDSKFTCSSSCELGFQLQPCNPADHCMTVERFLADGNGFVEGDIVMPKSEEVVVVTSKMMASAMSIKSRSDSDNFILRAAALEEKEPELTKDDSPQGVISAISNRLHNMGCEHQDSELGDELGSMACDIWEYYQ